MLSKLMNWAVVAVALVLGLHTAALAGSDLGVYQERVAGGVTRLAESTAKLQGLDRAEWTDVDIHKYLNDAIWAVCNGLLLYEVKYRLLPDAVEDLKNTEYVPLWPGNPFADWEPMEVLELSDGFKPGCLVIQYCPPEFYSGLSHPKPLSFELAVLGPDEGYAALGYAEPLKNNSWAAIPTGALYMLGSFTETAASTRKKYDRIMAARAKAAEEEAKAE